MLNERIEKHSEIGDVEGLYFLCKHLYAGIKNRNSLSELRLHHVGTISINLDNALMLMEVLEAEYKKEYLSLLAVCKEENIQNFKVVFSKLIVKYLVDNEVVRIDSISYDENMDMFYFQQQGIKLKYACYRNLLLSFNILRRRKEGGYYYIGDNDVITKASKGIRHKMTQQQLLDSLERQREEGELGEQFVLLFERQRLNLHPLSFMIRQISTMDVCSGYDIVSFNNDLSVKIDRFIEVKAYKGKPHFHWSSNERNVALLKQNAYYLYLVNIDKIEKEDYQPIIIQNPVQFFDDNIEWKSYPESFFIEEI